MPPALRPASSAQWNDWEWQLANSVEDVSQLPQLDRLREEAGGQLQEVISRYPVRVTPHYLSLVSRWTLADPIVRQFFPTSREIAADGLFADGLCEEESSPLPGLIHRYGDRVVIIVTDSCATLCRHCFRKRLWRAGRGRRRLTDPDAICSYILKRPAIREVILSGGDALMVEATRLFDLIRGLAGIDHISAVRIASRLPAVLPQRVDAELCKGLSDSGPVWFMTQFNHPNELVHEAAEACTNLIHSGIPVLNQTVLLAGVNDNAETLLELFRGLVALRVKPHYLFHGDPVAGSGHFRTGVRRGLEIMARLRSELSSLAMPRFAVDVAGSGGKISLEPWSYAGANCDGETILTTLDGTEIIYP